MTKKYYEIVKEMENLFHLFNVQFFNGDVETPIITVSADTAGGAYGWCTTNKVWKSDKEEYYEINICAEYLDRPIKEVCATLLHEMVHLDNIKKGIKDVSSNGYYHNKKFKETAEAHGLVIEKMGSYGWTKTSLQESTAEWIEKNIEYEKFNLARMSKRMKAGSSSGTSSGDSSEDDSTTTEAPKKSKYKYYMCPCCKVKFYTVATINATCDDCGETFVQYR